MSLRSVVPALLLVILLLAAPDARAGSYTVTYSGGQSVSVGVNVPGGTYTQPYSGTYGGGASTSWSSAGASATCSGGITATATWQPNGPGDNPPATAVVQETGTASWSGTGVIVPTGKCDDGLKDPEVDKTTPPVQHGAPTTVSGVSTGVHYWVKSNPGQSFQLTPTPSANVSCAPTQGGGNASVSYTANVSPVIITPGGTNNPTTGDYRVLTGQQITATLSGATGKVTAYTWSISPSATVFKTYNENAASNQLVALGSADLSGPAAGSTTVTPLAFYDRAQENLTVNCAVSFTAPDGTALSATAKSPSINVLKPTASWGVDPKTITANGQTVANLSVPSPFIGIGMGCFAQIVTPSATITRTPTGTGVSTYSFKIKNPQDVWVSPGTGLDKSFPFPIGFTTDANGNMTGQATDSSWSASGTGASGDYPKGQEIVTDVDNGGTKWTKSSISDSFTTWLMYKPDGGVWIPVQSATWKASGNASGGPSNWSATGNYTAPVPTNTNDFPQWSTVISNQEYRP